MSIPHGKTILLIFSLQIKVLLKTSRIFSPFDLKLVKTNFITP